MTIAEYLEAKNNNMNNNTTKPHAEIKTATKQLVDSLLAMNINNRNLKKSVINRYRSDIQKGNWKLTNQGIGVSVDSTLIDGQHRLHAIKECDYPPIPLLIVYGLDADSQIAVDAHAKRSARDMLLFAFGARVSKQAPSIGNVILRSCSTWSSIFSNHDLMVCVSEYTDEIELAVSVPKSGNFYSAPIMAAIVLELKKNPENKDKVIEFIQRVETGEMLDKTMPEFHLRNFIVTQTGRSGGREVQKERFHKASKALECFIKGEKMGVLRA
jgi:hypothetical protein